MFDAEAYLNGLTNWEPRLHQAGASSFSLDRMERLLLAFGRPDDKLKFAHVAGSKGKGSTAVFLAEILRAAGYRVGLYTSPHLYSVRERIRVLEPGAVCRDVRGVEGCITEQEFTDRLKFYHTDIDRLRQDGVDVTYYEVMTALAVSYFAFKQCQIVVLETGLGGRLDATNVFETSVCGITPVGLEHTAILGDTLAAIAAEKAGIIKSPSQRVAFAPQALEAMAVLKSHCVRLGIIPTVVGEDLPYTVLRQDAGGVVFTVNGRRDYGELQSPLIGTHQAANAALAIALAEDLETFGFLIEAQHVRRGVAEAVWPCRFEVFGHVVIDAAHTVESAQACAATLQRVFPDRRAVLLFGTGQDKDLEGIAAVLKSVVAAVVVTRADHPRAMDIDGARAKGLFGEGAVVVPEVKAAFVEALRLAGKDGIVFVAGSVFLAAEVRALLLRAKTHPECCGGSL